MPRFDWRDREEDRRGGRPDPRDREDFGQADYSTDYGYDPDARAGYRASEREQPRDDDYGQADYSGDWVYDRDRGRAYRRFSDDDREMRGDDRDFEARAREDREPDERAASERHRDERRREEREREDREPRSWMDRAGAFLGGRESADTREDSRMRRRRGPSDRVLWAVIVERLEDERGLDLRDIDVIVENAEVTLNGTVRHKADKRRIEDVADIDGVRHVQNNLRVRDRGHWTFL